MIVMNISIRLCSPLFALALFSTLMIGCGSPVREDDNRTAQMSFDEAVPLIDAENYQQALPLLEKSIAAGGLSADIYAVALLLRSRCYCDKGDIEKAQADLNHAEQGSPNTAQLLLAKGTLLAKQGKQAESDTAFKAAKKADPSIKLPKQ